VPIGAGIGLFAIVDIPRQTPLLTLPNRAKMNVKTLGHYPFSNRLTASQLISLHLLLHKPAPGCESDDPHFGPYISILPRDFGGHPLTWIIHRALGAGSREQHSLLRLLPPTVLSDLLLLEGRFWKDWDVVRQYLVGPARALFNYHRPLLMTLVRTSCPICPHHVEGHGCSQS